VEEPLTKSYCRFIYFLFLAQDANFRLSNRNVSSESADPIFGDGFGYFCKQEGEDGYKAHIAKHVNEQEVKLFRFSSHVHGQHAAGEGAAHDRGRGGDMFKARHVAPQWNRRPSSKRAVRFISFLGEALSAFFCQFLGLALNDDCFFRFCNMTFLLLSALLTFTLFHVMVSYDIACQFAVNFWKRMSEMPETMRLKIPEKNLWWKVPNFHLPMHKTPCHNPYSFHWMWGTRMTHGEGVEQNWSFSNGAVGSTRRMGMFGFHNYERCLAMCEYHCFNCAAVLMWICCRSCAPKETCSEHQRRHEALCGVRGLQQCA
jgi:hypothetical protein